MYKGFIFLFLIVFSSCATSGYNRSYVISHDDEIPVLQTDDMR